MKIPFSAIRHKPTGFYLPEPLGRLGRGGSHVEPTADQRPRLFPTKRGAVLALGAWLKGKVHHSSGYDSFSQEHYESTHLEPVPSRKREEMEIVEVELELP